MRSFRLPLARTLSALGHEAIYVLDVGLLDAGDNRIWDYALANGAVIISKDEDFAIRASLSNCSRNRLGQDR